MGGLVRRAEVKYPTSGCRDVFDYFRLESILNCEVHSFIHGGVKKVIVEHTQGGS